MANLTRAEIADRALEALGAKAAGQDSSAEDANRAGEAFDTVYEMLRKEGLAPFASTATPSWAQSAVIHLVAQELIPTFGTSGERKADIAGLAQKGKVDLHTQVAASKPPLRITAEYF
jgi:hypothetical protein